jgi:hypothetical protein
MHHSTHLLDLSRGELGALAAQLGAAANGLIPEVNERDVVRVAEDLLFSRCRDADACPSRDLCGGRSKLCLVEPDVDDLPWIFATAVLDKSYVAKSDRLRAAGILRALWRGAMAPCLGRAEGCPL